MKKIKLAEALLRRKELQAKVTTLQNINRDDMFVTRAGRKAVHEGIDDVIAEIPLLVVSQVTHALDWHSRQLRKVDSAIQQANWTTEIEVDDDMITDYIDPEPPERKKQGLA